MKPEDVYMSVEEIIIIKWLKSLYYNVDLLCKQSSLELKSVQWALKNMKLIIKYVFIYLNIYQQIPHIHKVTSKKQKCNTRLRFMSFYEWWECFEGCAVDMRKERHGGRDWSCDRGLRTETHWIALCAAPQDAEQNRVTEWRARCLHSESSGNVDNFSKMYHTESVWVNILKRSVVFPAASL